MNFDTFDTFDVKSSITAKSSTPTRKPEKSRPTCQTCQGEHISPPPADPDDIAARGEHRAEGDRASRAQTEAPPAWRPEGQEQVRNRRENCTTANVNRQGGSMQVMEQTAPTTPAAPEEALEVARAVVGELETAVSALPAAYAQAAKRGRADDLKQIRHQRVDLESELLAGRIRLVHAEIAVLQGTQVASRLRESEIAREGTAAESALIVARSAFDEAVATSNAVEGRASALRWEVQNVRKQILLAEDRLNALISAPMPD